jgi:hypothetical protein
MDYVPELKSMGPRHALGAGELWRGADGGLNYTIGGIDTPEKYFDWRKRIAEHFGLVTIGITTHPLDAITKPYICIRKFSLVRLEWDVWSGFFVSSNGPRSDKLLIEIANFCESTFPSAIHQKTPNSI